MELLKRSLYLDQLISKRNTPDIKIITGIRRSGKSKLLLTYMDYLKENDPTCNIIFIDFRQLDFESITNYHSLHQYVEQLYIADVNNYLCIDEVQLCDNFEKAIDSLHAKEKYDIYLTGSNAFMLSSDLATLFTGRYIEIEVFPFSFSEYREYLHLDGDCHEELNQYIQYGGMSGSYIYTDERDKVAYIKDVYQTILQRDLVDKYNLLDNGALSKIVEYMMDNVSNITSPNNIANMLVLTGEKTNHVTVSQYLDYLCKAFVLYKVNRYDIRGSKYLESLNKYYLADTSFRFSILGTRNMDWGRIYENIVFLELRRRGYTVYVGKLYQKEVDFVAMRQTEKIYIQVSDNLSHPETFEREYTPLLQIKDAYPKWILANTKHGSYDYKGIKIIDITYWLIGINK